jgi:HlyD family type I secretion membrane fusion protein
MSYGSVAAQDWFSGIPRSTRGPTLAGVAILSIAVFGFGAWGATAPLSGAIVTSGVFVATGQNKVVQHLEGGVIRDILVREGDMVEANQALMILDDTNPRAELRRLVLRQAHSAAVEARLRAEAEEAIDVTFPDFLLTNEDPDVARIVDSQRLTFQARRNNQKTEIAALEEGINALEERLEGTKVQLAGVHRQLGFFEEELEGKLALLRSGLIRKSDVLALQRARANLQGEVGRLTGEIGDSRERVARTREQIAGLKNAAIKASVEQLHEVRAELTDLRERIHAAQRITDRTRVTAPVQGVVVKLRYHTAGGVVEAGKNILELVPLQAELIIEVRVRPQDIDNVRRGQPAMVRLSALNQRITPMIHGEVVYVSADALPDEKRGPQFSSDIYVARVRLDQADANRVKGFEPTPGMPAEVYLKTTERTFFEYLLRPVKDSLSRAFRET